ncbi:hypothetical protein ACFTTZ_19755, partial [Amycolatopsis thailandensis]
MGTPHDIRRPVTLRTLTPDDWTDWRDLRLTALRHDPGVFGATPAHWENAPEERWRARLTDVPFNVLATPAGMDYRHGFAETGEPEILSRSLGVVSGEDGSNR